MRKIILWIILIILFILAFTKSTKGQDTIKIQRNEYKIIVLHSRHFRFSELDKLNSLSSKLKLGKAEDVNFISHNLKDLREKNILQANMLIYQIQKSENGYRLINPVSSNMLTTYKDSLNWLNARRLKTYFLLREY